MGGFGIFSTGTYAGIGSKCVESEIHTQKKLFFYQTNHTVFTFVFVAKKMIIHWYFHTFLHTSFLTAHIISPIHQVHPNNFFGSLPLIFLVKGCLKSSFLLLAHSTTLPVLPEPSGLTLIVYYWQGI